MQLFQKFFLYSKTRVGTIINNREFVISSLNSKGEGVRVTTRRGYSIIVTTNTQLKTPFGFSLPSVGTVAEIAPPPPIKWAFSTRPLSAAKLVALVQARNSITLNSQIRFSVLLLWLKTLIRPIPFGSNNLQVLIWACGFHLRTSRKRGKHFLSKRTSKIDTITRITPYVGTQVKTISFRSTNSYYPLNSFKLKTR